MVFVANWKMYMGYKQAIKFLYEFKKKIKTQKEKNKFLFLPPSCLSFLFQKEDLYWGGQNISFKNEGALTGETSAKTLKELGAHFCLLGHSERRYIFGESDTEIKQKFRILQSLNLIPILCVGESKEQQFKKEFFLKKQLSWIKKNKKYQKQASSSEEQISTLKNIPLAIAYEPLWSIGTGQTPSQEEIQTSCLFIKDYLGISSLKVLYGGSVNQNTIKNMLHISSIDGFLIGKASLDPNQFYNIYQEYQNAQ